MSCCNNKKYVDTSCVKSKEWDDVNDLLGVTDCGSVVKVKKPLYELDEQDRDKLDTLTTSGQGNKVLADNGKYKTVEELGAVVNGNNSGDVAINTPSGNISLNGREGVVISAGNGQNVDITGNDLTFNGESVLIDSDISDVVTYDTGNNINPRNNIVLKNGASLSGKTTDGNTFKIASITSGDGVELGSDNIGTTIKSSVRPYVQTRDGNSERVAYLSEVEAATGDLSDLSGRVDNLETDLTDFKADTAENFSQTNENLQTVTNNLSSLQTATDNAFNAVNETLTDLRTDVDTNTENIAVNTQEIESLRNDFNNEDHFKGYFETSAEIQQIPGSTGAYAWSAESGTVWIYDGNSWVDSGTPIPDQSVDASDDVPRMDGEATPGTSNRYSRGDHRHPTDITRAAASDLDNYLPLAGNNQTTRMTGDLWMGSENKIRLSDSGNTYIEQVTEQQQTQVVSTGVGGIDLISSNGTNKSNGKEIAVKEDVEAVSDSLTALQADYNQFKPATNNRLTSLEGLTEQHTGQISSNTAQIQANTGNIAQNTQDIADLKEEVDQAELFKGYFATTAEITALQGSRGAFAWNGQTGTVWVYDADLLTWRDSLQPIPVQGTDPYNENPAMDGVANPGTVSEYARGNHVHPTDTSRAALSDLQGVAARVTVNEGNISSLQSGVEEIKEDIGEVKADVISLDSRIDSEVSIINNRITTEVDTLNNRIDEVEGAQSDYVPIAGNTATPMTGDLKLSNDKAVVFNTSGTTRISYHEDNGRLQIESPTAKGIELTTQDGNATINGVNIAKQTDIDAVNDSINELSDSTDVAISDVKGSISETNSNVTALTGRVESAEGDISTLQNSIGSQESRLSTAEGQIVTINSNLSAAQTQINNYVSSNDARVGTLETNVFDLQGRTSANEASISTLQSTVATNSSDIQTLTGNVATNTANISTLSTGLTNANNNVTALTSRVSTNETNIATNASDIQSILDRLGNDEYFRGYFETTAEITALENPVAGNFAYNGETGTIWTYNGTTWADSGTDIPNQAVPPSDSVPLMDGVGDAGSSSEYSRGDHRHPIDTSRAAQDEFADLQTVVSGLETDTTGLREDVDKNTAGVSANASAISTLQSNLSTAQDDITDLQDSTSANAANISGLTTRVETAENGLSDAQEDITTIYQSVATNTGDITTLQSNVDSLQAADSENVKLSGPQTISGTKTFIDSIITRAIEPDINAQWDIGKQLVKYNRVYANSIGSTTYPTNQGWFDLLYKGRIPVATEDDIKSIYKESATGTASITIPSEVEIVSVNYNRLLLFETDYSYSGTTLTVTNTDITGTIESTDKIEVTYLN